ncbi:unnamed protein product [Aspergillus oryzae]|nr:unnamed protein product [Aspergillus oryzae]GMF90258.1 unnamed protein product [Aspergillus oryzae]
METLTPLSEWDVAAFELENYRCSGNYGANRPWLATSLAMVRRRDSSSNELQWQGISKIRMERYNVGSAIPLLSGVIPRQCWQHRGSPPMSVKQREKWESRHKTPATHSTQRQGQIVQSQSRC